MSGIDLQMDYEAVEQMITIFNNGANQLDETASAMENVAQAMENGALLGEGGDAFAEALRKILAPRIRRIKAKFEEMSKDVKFAMDAVKRGDNTAKGRFL